MDGPVVGFSRHFKVTRIITSGCLHSVSKLLISWRDQLRPRYLNLLQTRITLSCRKTFQHRVIKLWWLKNVELGPLGITNMFEFDKESRVRRTEVSCNGPELPDSEKISVKTPLWLTVKHRLRRPRYRHRNQATHHTPFAKASLCWVEPPNVGLQQIF